MTSNKVTALEKKIRALAATERASLFEQIDDLFDAEWTRHVRKARKSAVAQGVDPEDGDSLQRLVDSVRYAKST